ncbi:AAA family ATPase [Pedococcus sp. KACC 23699]|uniref:AAA family ATPase n=1 Tax=Pedococcus sp. KACC 23699 TaxID=3149228 RepID=A0AAU7JU31_9MICO
MSAARTMDPADPADPTDDVGRIVRLIATSEPRCGSTRLVALDGPSGAGKTTLAADVAEALGAPVIHMDDLYPGWDGLAASTERVESWVVAPLLSGGPARYRRWDWEAGEYAEWHEAAGDVIVLEGCGSGALPGGTFLSVLVWVDADPTERRTRAVARDPGYAPFWDRWAAQEQALYAADGTRARADLLLDTTTVADPSHTRRMSSPAADLRNG